MTLTSGQRARIATRIPVSLPRKLPRWRAVTVSAARKVPLSRCLAPSSQRAPDRTDWNCPAPHRTRSAKQPSDSSLRSVRVFPERRQKEA
jgi:hypothetical protein